MSSHAQSNPPKRGFLDWLFSTSPTGHDQADRYAFVPPFSPSLPLNPHVISKPKRNREEMGEGITASARRLTESDSKSKNEAAKGGAGKVAGWQEEAWELLDLIGEQRFLAHTLAGRMAQASLYVGKAVDENDPGSKPEHVEDVEVQDLLKGIGDGKAGQSQLIHRAGVNLFVAGEVWLVGVPPSKFPGTPEYEEANRERVNGTIQIVQRSLDLDPHEPDGDDVQTLKWRMLSVDEVTLDTTGDEVTLSLEDGKQIKGATEDFYLIRIWRPHPRRAWEADSPTRASLPVLRELLGLTQHIGAQIDSRLAGAGLLAVSSEVDAALKRASGLDENDQRSPLMEALTIAMQTPIKDRSSAAAVVPLAVTVPGKPSEAFHYMTFSTPLDKEAPKHRDEAIRRLALGQDAPPELLLGTGGMNHWGAWLVREDVVTTHLEPPLALLCDALTEQYLRPILREMGYSEETLSDYMVWYDVDHLIARPNRTQDAKDLYAQGAITRKALRDATGFEESDAPAGEGSEDPVMELVITMVSQTPSLASVPGIGELYKQMKAMLEGNISETSEAPVPPVPSDSPSPSSESGGSIPATDGNPPPAGTPGNPGGGA